MKGVIEEGNSAMKEADEGSVRDAALIPARAVRGTLRGFAYGTVRTYADQLGQAKCAQLLEETLEEEKATDQNLASIAEKVNRKSPAKCLRNHADSKPLSSPRKFFELI